MIPGKITTIHLVGDQDFRLKCLGSGQTPSIRDRLGRNGFFLGCSAIRSIEHDLASIFLTAASSSRSGKSVDSALLTAPSSTCSLHLRDEKDPTVTCALQGGAPRIDRMIRIFS